MPPKRKAATAAKGAAKSGKTSALSTPGPGTPRSLAISDDYDPNDEDFDPDAIPEEDKKHDEEIGKAADEFINDWDIGSKRFQKGMANKRTDSAAHYFGSGKRDFSWLSLKPDHTNRPMWIGRVVLRRISMSLCLLADVVYRPGEGRHRPRTIPSAGRPGGGFSDYHC